MKRRDRQGRYRSNERWTQIVGHSILVGIVLGIVIHVLSQPVVYVNEVEARESEEVVVKLEVKIDWTPDRVEEEIRKVFPEMPNTAVAVAIAESELNPDAFNPEAHRGCVGSIGIMQVACVHHKSNPAALHDIQTNLKKARAIYDDSLARTGNGWLPWGAYTDGRYKLYL